MSRIFRRVSQMFDFQDDVAEGEFLKKEGGLLVGGTAGGGGLTFAQILAAYAAAGFTFDDATGEVTFAPSDDTLDTLVTVVAPDDFENNTAGSGSFVKFVNQDGIVVLALDTYSDFTLISPVGNMPPTIHLESVEAPGAYVRFRGYRPESGSPQAVVHIFDGTDTVFKLDSVGRVTLPLGVQLLTGNGSPEGVVEAEVASVYFRKDGGAGTTWYMKASGITDTGWVAVPSAADVTAAVAAHEADTTAVHGIADTANLSLVGHAHSGADITSGTVVDARIDAAIARDSEVTAAVAAEATARDTAIGVETSARTAADALLVPKSLYDANTVLAANTDDTPAAVTMAASTILARLAAGNIKAASVAEIKTLLALALDDLSDAAVSSASAAQILKHDGSNFVNTSSLSAFRPTGSLVENYPRIIANNGIASLASQRLSLTFIELPKGLLITSITFVSGAQALNTGVHQFFGLFDDAAGSSGGSGYALLRGSVDDTSTAWGTNTIKTLALTSTYTTVRAGLFYVGILVQATTTPHLQGPGGLAPGVAAVTPLLGGLSSTGLSALPNPAAAPTALNPPPYCWVS